MNRFGSHGDRGRSGSGGVDCIGSRYRRDAPIWTPAGSESDPKGGRDGGVKRSSGLVGQTPTRNADFVLQNNSIIIPIRYSRYGSDRRKAFIQLSSRDRKKGTPSLLRGREEDERIDEIQGGSKAIGYGQYCDREGAGSIS